jgi:hypothetical protein
MLWMCQASPEDVEEQFPGWHAVMVTVAAMAKVSASAPSCEPGPAR